MLYLIECRREDWLYNPNKDLEKLIGYLCPLKNK